MTDIQRGFAGLVFVLLAGNVLAQTANYFDGTSQRTITLQPNSLGSSTLTT